MSGSGQIEPLSRARAQAARVVRARRFGRIASLVRRRSDRLDHWLSRRVAGSGGYIGHPAPVVSEGPRRWTPGQSRLLMISHDLSSSGAPRVVEEVARIFDEAGWYVTVAAPVDGPARDAMLRHAALVIDPTVLDERSPMLAALASGSDLALANTVVSAGAVLSLAATVPVFWYLHEVSLLADMVRSDERLPRALTAAARVFAGSELPASLVRDLRPDTRVLPYGLRPLPAAEHAREPGSGDPVGIAVFGAIEPRKGQDLAVAALAALPREVREGVRLTLYGRVLDREFADDLAPQVAAMPEVTLGGELNAAAYGAAMIAADVVLVSSRDDTLPLVSLDALSAGRVLVCTPTTGTSAWLADGVDGFVAAAADAGGIAATLAAVLARRGAWPAIGRAGRAVFDATFSEQAFAAAILAEAGAVARG